MDPTNQKRSTITITSTRTKSHTLLCLITGPSGSGKTSIALELQKRFLPPVPSTNQTEPTVIATVIHQDRYFTRPFLPYQDRTDDSYETGASIDWDRILADIESLAVDAAEAKEHATTATTTATTTAGATTSTGAAAKRRQTAIVIVEGHLLGELAPRIRQRFFGGGHNGDRPLGRGRNSSPLVDSVLAVLLVGCSSQTCKRRRIERNPDRSADEADALARYYDAHVWPSFLTHGRRATDAIKREFAPSSVSRSGSGCPTGAAAAKRRDDAPFPAGFVLEIDNSERASREENIESIAKKIRDMVSCR